MTRVAFIIPSLKNGWLGGANYLRNLLWAISITSARNYEVLLFLGNKTTLDSIGEIPSYSVVRSKMFDRMTFAWLMRKVIFLVTGSDILLDRLLRRHGVSVLSHGHALGQYSKVKTIGWIPDFQHRHLPDFFSEKERAFRDKEFERLLLGCDHVVVSSESAYGDVENFYGQYINKVSILSFAVRQPGASQIVPLSDLQALYKFSEDYIYIPNQFWAHKNHSVVVDAIAALGEKAPLCILTGATQDYRHPNYFPDLLKKINSSGVQERIRILGVVPYGHVVSLMTHARMVLNPSLFEGWSTTVEEAKALGKTMVLSDIKVHREQAPQETLFFSARDPIALSKNITEAFSGSKSEGVDRYADAANERFQRYGMSYLSIVDEVFKTR